MEGAIGIRTERLGETINERERDVETDKRREVEGGKMFEEKLLL